MTIRLRGQRTSIREYSEKRRDSQAKPGLPVAAKIGIGAAAATAGFALASLLYAYLATHPPRRRFSRTPAEIALEFEDIHFPSRDGVRLSGWLLAAPFPAETRGVIVLCHGYPMNRLEMLPYAKFLHEAGFTTLVFDFRALGRSEGAMCSFGHKETGDLQGAIDYVAGRQDTAGLPIGVFGLSLGAAVAIMGSADDSRVGAVAAEAPYPNVRDALNRRCGVVFGPAGRHIAQVVLWWARCWLPVDPSRISPALAAPALAPRPLLLIQGQRDMLVDWRDAVRMAESTPHSTELWLLPGAGHARCFRVGGDAYRRRVAQFFITNLGRE